MDPDGACSILKHKIQKGNTGNIPVDLCQYDWQLTREV